MPFREAITPAEPLYRIGRPPDPLAWPRPRPRRGNKRFDDPRAEFRVLYAGATRRVCFLETLAPFRPNLSLLSQLRRIRTGSTGYDVPPVERIPDDMLGRLMGSSHLQAGQRWLDFRSAETYQALREEYPDTLITFGYDDFDASHALSADRNLTQTIARLAFHKGFDGVAYKSRLDPTLDCWALFDRCRIDPVAIEAISADDLDLVQVAALYGLSVR